MFAVIIVETGMAVGWAYRKRDIDMEEVRRSGFVLPTDKLAIVRVPLPAKCDGCEGVDEDWVVEFGECDICGGPVSRRWPAGLD